MSCAYSLGAPNAEIIANKNITNRDMKTFPKKMFILKDVTQSRFATEAAGQIKTSV